MKKIMVGMELLKKAPSSNLLYHQKRTVEGLREDSVVFNIYPTGSGKTRAALERLKECNDNTLIIAPTNEILVQHYNDVVEFVEDNNLSYRVIRVDAKIISKIAKKYPDRRGKILYNILSNPSEYSDELGIEGSYGKIIVITNPDIFYYCVYGRYGYLDKSNLMETMVKKFNYIIIDEFHYYNSKQLINFLYFMALSKHFGYMESKRKICILTATPDELIEKYFDRLNLKYKVLSMENESEDSKEYGELKTLSKMDLFITNQSLEDVVLEYYKDNNLTEDSVIISNSLIKVHKIKQILYGMKMPKNNIGLITGVIDSKERKEAVDKKIIIATTTVDIGYNFKKKDKESQNIDTVLIEAKTYDEAIQRIGRAGRILGKDIQNKRCKVIMSVSNEVYDRFNELKEEITRKELKDIIKSKMPANTLMKRYIQSGAILEMMVPLEDLYYKFPKNSTNGMDRDTVIVGLYNKLNEVFANGKGRSFQSMLAEVKIYKKYKKFLSEYEKKDEKETFILDEFNDGFNGKGVLGPYLLVEILRELEPEDGIEIEDLKGLKNKNANNLKLELIEETLDYMEKTICLTETLLNFRGERPNIKLLIYDKFNIFTQDKQIFHYDIFHVLRYYDVYFYSSKNEFINDIEKEHLLIREEMFEGNESFYVKIKGIKDNTTKLEYKYKTNFDKQEFESKLANMPKAIKGLELVVYEKTKKGEFAISLKEEIRKHFKTKYMPVFIISDDKIKSQVRRITKDNFIITEKLEVEFCDGYKKMYDILIGSDAKLIDYEVLRLKDKAEKSESYIF